MPRHRRPPIFASDGSRNCGTRCDPSQTPGAVSKGKEMNKFASTSIVISLGLCSFGAAQAADMTGEDSGSFHLSQQRWVSSRSRAEVTAEAVNARSGGELTAFVGEDSGSAYLSRMQPASVLARAAVLEELRLARTSGQAGAMIGEDSGSVYLARAASERTTRYVGPSQDHDAAQTVRMALASGAR